MRPRRIAQFSRWFNRRVTRAGAAVAICLMAATAGFGAEEVQRGGDAVFLDTDNVAVKKISAARDFFAGEQWQDGIDLLRQAADQNGEKLVAIGPGRYMNVRACCQALLSRLPPAGLAVYRAKVDLIASRWYQSAVGDSAESLLQRIVQEAFASSSGDVALLQLGDRAWEQGDLDQACHYWQKLVAPLPGQSERVPRDAVTLPSSLARPPRDPFGPLHFPGPRFPPAEIHARIILAHLLQKVPDRGSEKMEQFRRLYPDAQGNFAGRTGRLIDALAAVQREMQTSEPLRATSEVRTFAGHASRNFVVPQSIDIGAVQWTVPLKETTLSPVAAARFDNDREPPLQGLFGRLARPPLVVQPGYFPAISGQTVLLCDDSSVYAWNLRTGKPAWPGIDPRSAAIYTLPPERRSLRAVTTGIAGLPWYTVTVEGGRAFARLGGISLDSRERPQVGPQFLVGLDIAAGEGKLLWLLEASQVDPQGGDWTFEGTPVAAGDRLYVSIRRSQPKPQVNVVCLDPSHGHVVWNQKVCTGLEMFGGEVLEIGQQVLTVANGQIFFATNLGAIAALDAQRGTVQWVTTYPHQDSDSISTYDKRQRQGPNPCLFHEGILVTAPHDADAIYAHDAESGQLLWERQLRGQPRAVLGAVNNTVIVAGDRLLALQLHTGKNAWRLDVQDSELHGYGRGILAGELVYWPSREEIFIVQARTGQLQRRVSLEAPVRHAGGNLVMASGFLLVATPSRLIARCEYGRLIKQYGDEISQHPQTALPHYLLGLALEATGDNNSALAHYRQAHVLAKVDEEWESRSLREQSADRLYSLLLVQGATAAQQSLSPRAAELFREAARLPGTAARRLVARQKWVQLLEQRGQFVDAVSALQEVLEDPSLAAEYFITESSAGHAMHGGTWAEREISRLIARQGPAIYAQHEANAERAFALALRETQPDALAALLRKYPNARSAPRHWLQLGRQFRAQKSYHAATLAWRHLWPQSNLIGDSFRGGPGTIGGADLPASDSLSRALTRDALRELALLAEARGFTRIAQEWWQRLGQSFPKESLTHAGREVPVRVAVAEKLAASAEGAATKKILEATGWRKQWSINRPENPVLLFPTGESPGFSADCLLLVGTSLECLDLQTGVRRWEFPCDDVPHWAAFAEDLLLVGSSRQLLAFEPDTGRLAWRHRWEASAKTASVSSRSAWREFDFGDTDSLRPHRFRTANTRISLGRESGPFRRVARPRSASQPRVPFCDYRVEQGQVVCLVGEERLAALAASSGELLWTYRPAKGAIQPHWCWHGAQITLQTAGPDRVQVLHAATGWLAFDLPGWDAPWQAPPVPLPEGRLACVTAPLRLQLFSASLGKTLWDYPGPLSQAHAPPAWLWSEKGLFLLKDGNTLCRVDPQTGRDLWSVRPAAAPLLEGAESLHGDARGIFLVAGGMLRCFNRETGGLDWEQFLGGGSTPWRILSVPGTLILHPQAAAAESRVVFADPVAGEFLQTLPLPPARLLYSRMAGQTLVIAGDGMWTGYVPE